MSQLNNQSRQPGSDSGSRVLQTSITKLDRSLNKTKTFLGIRIATLSLLILTLFLQVSFSDGTAAAAGLGSGSQARVTGTDGAGVRLRTTPDVGNNTVTILQENWQVTILSGPYSDKAGDSFYKVEWANKQGYVMSQYLTYAGRSGVNLSVGSSARVNADGDGVNMRSGPSTSASVIRPLGEDWQVSIVGGPVSGFYKVEWANQQGYVSSSYLTFSGKASSSVGSHSVSNGRVLSIGGQVKVAGTGGDGVRMHQFPSAGSPTINILPETYLVSVLAGPFNDDQGNTFYQVEWAGQTGYITNSYLTPASATAVAGVGGYMRVTNTGGDPIRFRSQPTTAGGVSDLLYEGQSLKLLAGPYSDAAGRHWYKLDLNGKVGYADATYLARTSSASNYTAPVVSHSAPAPVATPVRKVAPSSPVTVAPKISAPSNGPLGSRIVSYAEQFLGYRYVWGGGSPAAGGFDCSGLVSYVLNNLGIGVGHSVYADLGVGSAVSLSDLQPGDLVIFANTYEAGPSHVGIYIGGGRFVHAENYSSGVTISSMSDPYYASRFYAARRPGA